MTSSLASVDAIRLHFSISRLLRQEPPTTEHLRSRNCLISQRLCLTVGELWKEEQVVDYLDLLVHRKWYSGCQASGDIFRRRIRVVLGGDQRPPGRLLRVSLTGGSNDWLLYNTHAIASARPSRHHPIYPVDLGSKRKHAQAGKSASGYTRHGCPH
jgi:hypothetical protein